MINIPNVSSPRELSNLLSQYNLKAQHGLGQNFLIDGNIVQKIVEAADLKPGDAALEIGPGAGALTVELARRQIRIIALEIDRGFVRLLDNILRPFTQVTVICGDALKVDYVQLNETYFAPGQKVKLISNLPYYLSSPLMYRLFEQKFPFSGAVLMFQKEVAQRVLAWPGTAGYGSLSVLCQYYTGGSHLFNVSKNVFWPRPEVESTVISLNSRPPILSPAEEDLLWQIVKTAFQQRRKTMLNSLDKRFNWSRNILASLIRQAGFDPACRPENLSLGQFAKLAQIIYNYNE